MRGWGIILIILGIGSYILPLMGRQFWLVSLFGGSPFIGVGFVLFGVFFIFAGSKPADRE